MYECTQGVPYVSLNKKSFRFRQKWILFLPEHFQCLSIKQVYFCFIFECIFSSLPPFCFIIQNRLIYVKAKVNAWVLCIQSKKRRWKQIFSCFEFNDFVDHAITKSIFFFFTRFSLVIGRLIVTTCRNIIVART